VQPRDILSRKEAMSPENLDILRRLYDGVIREMDREIERLFVRLEEQGELDRTLVVITADHGEEFGEHDKLGHGRTLHEEVIRVPLIFWAADGLPSHRSEVPFHHVDLLPTMLDALGVAIPSGLDGQSRWSELVQGRLAPREEYLFLLEQKRPAELALISPPWKLIHRVGGPTNLLFDLRTDPREERDLADQSEARGEMLRKLAKAHNDLSAHMADRRTADVDPDTRARIEALGYVQPKEGEPTERRIPRRIEVSEEEVVVVPPQPSVGTPRRPSREGKG
jgi:arylsulfatase A-like enzyme